MKRFRGKVLVLFVLLLLSVTALHAARLTLFIDGDNRTPYDASRGKVGRAEWTAAVNARKGAILTDNFNGVNIDVPEGKETSVGNFSIFFTQTGGISTQAGNTAKVKHPTGVFVGTTGTGSTAGKNDEQIEGIELRYETGAQKTTALELRFNPPIFAWAADVFSVDGKSYEPYRRENGDHTTLHILGHDYDLARIFAYSSGGRPSARHGGPAGRDGRARPARGRRCRCAVDAATDRHRRARPGARRWHRAGLGHAARRRARHRQEHAGAPAPGVVAGCRRCTSAPRSGPSRCGCGPSGSARCGPTCGWRPRPRWPASSPPSSARRPRWSSSTASRPSPTIGCPRRRGRCCRCASARSSSCRRPSGEASPCVLVGHVTKDGALAGPRALEHVVDTVLSFEGERHHALRLLRAVKHRFGSTNELGLFEMTGTGLAGVPDPSKLFLADRRTAVAGSVVVPAMDGRRPLLVEVQALTVPVPPGRPGRRNAQGVDGGRLALLLAVLQRRARPAGRRPGRLRVDRRRRAR